RTWLLGSSPRGSELAAGLGIGYCFAGFINPAAAADALQNYRQRFTDRGFGLDQPRAILAVNVAVGDTPEEGQRLALSPKGFYVRLTRAGRAAGSVTVPVPEDAKREMSDAERAEPTRIVDGRWPRFVAGGPDEVRTTLEHMVEASGADEVMVQDLISDPSARHRAHELLADVFSLRAGSDEISGTRL